MSMPEPVNDGAPTPATNRAPKNGSIIATVSAITDAAARKSVRAWRIKVPFRSHPRHHLNVDLPIRKKILRYLSPGWKHSLLCRCAAESAISLDGSSIRFHVLHKRKRVLSRSAGKFAGRFAATVTSSNGGSAPLPVN